MLNRGVWYKKKNIIENHILIDWLSVLTLILPFLQVILGTAGVAYWQEYYEQFRAASGNRNVKQQFGAECWAWNIWKVDVNFNANDSDSHYHPDDIYIRSETEVPKVRLKYVGIDDSDRQEDPDTGENVGILIE